ncbi:MFS family permease [Crossiella equi]|uniref:MFS family permease n=1 Tax=Crossiella equi TaxID=130796 RepID=A0ABS5ARK7_9PSEU|nr:MFS transporter [Crossiella equi]MBP2478854.1 MFS family permease [Crossiella equi]
MPPTTELRRARAAVAAVFLTNGAVYANLVPRYPQLKDELLLNNAELGTALAGMPLGALLAGLLAGVATRRFGSARVATLGNILLAGATVLASVSPVWFALATALFLAGVMDALADVAQNAHGLRVQRGYGRSIVNSFHGLWSIGAVTGGLMGTAAAGLAVPLPVHLGVSAGLFTLVSLAAYRFLLSGPDNADRAGSPSLRAVRGPAIRMLAVLSLLATCGAFVEDAGASWGAVYLSDSLRTTAATAGLAFVAMQVAMTAGRLTGDRAVDRFGQRAVVRFGGALTAVGMGVALAFPTVGTTLAGFALAGFGVATLIPAAMHTADELPGLPHGVGLTVVSWLLRIGFLISPPLVGLIADGVGLRVGLLTVVVAGVVTVVGGRVLANRP